MSHWVEIVLTVLLFYGYQHYRFTRVILCSPSLPPRYVPLALWLLASAVLAGGGHCGPLGRWWGVYLAHDVGSYDPAGEGRAGHGQGREGNGWCAR